MSLASFLPTNQPFTIHQSILSVCFKFTSVILLCKTSARMTNEQWNEQMNKRSCRSFVCSFFRTFLLSYYRQCRRKLTDLRSEVKEFPQRESSQLIQKRDCFQFSFLTVQFDVFLTLCNTLARLFDRCYNFLHNTCQYNICNNNNRNNCKYDNRNYDQYDVRLVSFEELLYTI